MAGFLSRIFGGPVASQVGWKGRRKIDEPVYLKHPGVQEIPGDNSIFLLRPLSDPISLNEMGAFIWSQVATPRAQSEVVSAFRRRFRVDKLTATRAFNEFLDHVGADQSVVRLPSSALSLVPRIPGMLSSVDANEVADSVTEVLIPGELRVDVYPMAFDSADGLVECWTCMTGGLLSHGQKELIYSLKREPGEGLNDYPRELLRLCAMVHHLALQGCTVDVNGFTSTASEAGFLGGDLFHGIHYTFPLLPGDAHVQSQCVTAIFLTREELQVAQEYGPVRVLALLGMRYQRFPTPDWADRNRPDIITMKELEGSFLAKVIRLKAPGILVYETEVGVATSPAETTGRAIDTESNDASQRVILEISASTTDWMKTYMDNLPESAPVAILSGSDPQADACLCWDARQDLTMSLSDAGEKRTRLAGNFIGFLPERPVNGGMILEDGFVFELTGSTWERVQDALRGGKPFFCRCPGEGPDLAIRWLPET